MKRILALFILFVSLKSYSQTSITDFINSSDYDNYVKSFIDRNYTGLSQDLQKASLKTMDNSHSTPVITVPYVNDQGAVILSVESTQFLNDSIEAPNGSRYLIMLRDFSSYDTSTGNGTIKMFDLSYDGYQFADAVITNYEVTNNTFYEMPQEIATKYSAVISHNSEYASRHLTPGQAQCDYNHNDNISYGECYKCFNSACQSDPNCTVMCYLFGDVIGWLIGRPRMPQCQIAIGLACLYISWAY